MAATPPRNSRSVITRRRAPATVAPGARTAAPSVNHELVSSAPARSRARAVRCRGVSATAANPLDNHATSGMATVALTSIGPVSDADAAAGVQPAAVPACILLHRFLSSTAVHPGLS